MPPKRRMVAARSTWVNDLGHSNRIVTYRRRDKTVSFKRSILWVGIGMNVEHLVAVAIIRHHVHI